MSGHQLEIVETPSMKNGVGHLNLCQQCGAIISVPGDIWDKPKTLTGPCPVCLKTNWLRLKRPEGPFRWADE